jgi:MFS superfamily sulfate permease-like transporter
VAAGFRLLGPPELPPVTGEHFHERLWHLIAALPQLNPPTAALAVLSLLLVVYAPRVKLLARVPGPLVAMTVATVLEVMMHPHGVATLGSTFGGIPVGSRANSRVHAKLQPAAVLGTGEGGIYSASLREALLCAGVG